MSWSLPATAMTAFGTGCAVFAVAANTLTVIVLSRHAPLQRSVSNLYCVSLAGADLAVSLLAFAVLSAQLAADTEIGKRELQQLPFEQMADACQLLDLILLTTSLYSVCAIALDRVWNLEKPLRVFKRSRRIARRLVAFIWLTPLCLWLPFYVVAKREGHWSRPVWAKSEVYDEVSVMPRRFVDRWQSGGGGGRPDTTRGEEEVDGGGGVRIEQAVLASVAIPFIYLPTLALLCMFVRISLVVRRHLLFLREHSSAATSRAGYVPAGPSANSSPLIERSLAASGTVPTVSSPLTVASPGGGRLGGGAGGSSRISSLTTSRLPSLTGSVDTTCSSSMLPTSSSAMAPKKSLTLALGSNSSLSPRPASGQTAATARAALTPLAEEKSSRERSQSEHMEKSPVVCRLEGCLSQQPAQVENPSLSSASTAHSRIVGVASAPSVRTVTIQRRTRSVDGKLTSTVKIRDCSVVSSKMSLSSASMPSTGRLRQLSSSFRRHASLRKLSSMAFPSNIHDLLHRDGVSQQVRAAKAVALILCCFVVCWLPFLVCWPLKIFCRECVSDGVFRSTIRLNWLASALNPLLYTLTSPRVVQVLKRQWNRMWGNNATSAAKRSTQL